MLKSFTEGHNFMERLRGRCQGARASTTDERIAITEKLHRVDKADLASYCDKQNAGRQVSVSLESRVPAE